jgi:hypothetical protein
MTRPEPVALKPEPALKPKPLPQLEEVNQKSSEEQLSDAIFQKPSEVQKLLKEHPSLNLNWHKNN